MNENLLNQDGAPEMFRNVAFAMFGVKEVENPDIEGNEVPEKFQHLSADDDIFNHEEAEAREDDMMPTREDYETH